jgi:prevent-host-death family protein
MMPRPRNSPTTIVEIGAGAFKDRCLQLLDQVARGEIEVIVTKHGNPVAHLVRPTRDVPSAFGSMRGTVLDHDDIVSPDLGEWGDLA